MSERLCMPTRVSSRISAGRLTLLALVSLLAPGLLFYQGIAGRTVDWISIGTGSVVLFLLVLARMYGLVSKVQDQASQLAALAHHDALTGVPNRRAWDLELARHGVALAADRAAVVERLAEPFASHAEALGLDGGAELAYRPRSHAETAEELAAELAERVESDLERGFTGHGPHRDELVLRREGRELRAYGSRGQQRLGLLALLLAEREALADSRGTLDVQRSPSECPLSRRVRLRA